MPRDYKDIKKQAKQAAKNTGSLISNLFSFIAGLSLGLFIAAYAFMQPGWLDVWEGLSSGNADDAHTASRIYAKPETQPAAEVPMPKFEFYDILRMRKLNITETIASNQEGVTDPNAEDTSIYVLQVGSFADFQSADQLKAQLALLGISSYITRIVLNGQDSIHRVRIGPFEDPEKLRQTQAQLEENDFQYMMLKLELDDSQG
jgi:cell division septation protein DedD